MRIKSYTLVLAILAWASMASLVHADPSAQERENKIKTAFLYNFLKFVDWPQDKKTDSKDTMVLSIIGENTFGDAFDAISTKTVDEKKLVIKYFLPYKELTPDQKEEIGKSHLLFIANSEQQSLKDILNLVDGKSVLTIADMKQFLESGGHINFVVGEKVGFEINLGAAKKANLTLRAQLLKVALRVIGEKEAADKTQSLTTHSLDLRGKLNQNDVY